MNRIKLNEINDESSFKLNPMSSLSNSDNNRNHQAAVAATVAADDLATVNIDLKRKVKRKCLKNLLALCVSYLVQFAASNGMNNLQSSMNGTLGIHTLVIITLSFTLSCLFNPVIISKYLGYKWSLILSQFGQLLYILANFVPSYWTLMPTGFVNGISNAVLWTYQGSFIAELASDYSKASSQKSSSDAVLIRFFGIFQILFQLNQVIGNLLSSLVFSFSNTTISSLNTTSSVLNETIREYNSTVNYSLCGANDLPSRQDVLFKPESSLFNRLCSIYAGLSLTGILVLIIFLDNIKPQNAKDTLYETVKKSISIFSYLKTWLYIPFLAFLSFTSTFFVVDFSKSFISCSYGVGVVGYLFCAWGLSSSLFSFLIGPLIKCIGRFVCILFVFTITLSILVFMLLWTPDKDNLYVLYIIVIIFGALEACWATINNATISIVYKDNQQAAFSQNRFFTSLLFFTAFLYSGYLSVEIKLYILMTVTAVAFVGFILFDFVVKKELENKKKSIEQNINA